jgi:hypothetical protein
MPLEQLRAMSKSGAPMDVIISENVYVHVYGPRYLIREGKTISYRDRSLKTYIVKAVED